MKPIIPPPILATLFGGLMGVAAWKFPIAYFHIPFWPKLAIALLLAAIGFAIATIAVGAFSKADTTINPIKIADSSALVTSGLYRFTRNPMYLGMVFVLAGWAVYLAALLPIAGIPLFMLTLTHLQIKPEEAMMRKTFGEEFDAYSKRVRRWL